MSSVLCYFIDLKNPKNVQYFIYIRDHISSQAFIHLRKTRCSNVVFDHVLRRHVKLG